MDAGGLALLFLGALSESRRRSESMHLRKCAFSKICCVVFASSYTSTLGNCSCVSKEVSVDDECLPHMPSSTKETTRGTTAIARVLSYSVDLARYHM